MKHTVETQNIQDNDIRWLAENIENATSERTLLKQIKWAAEDDWYAGWKDLIEGLPEAGTRWCFSSGADVIVWYKEDGIDPLTGTTMFRGVKSVHLVAWHEGQYIYRVVEF